MTEQAPEAGIEYVNIDVEVGILVQSLMFRHRQKQSDLGKVLGIGQATISRKLRGDIAFSVSDLMRIGRAYDVDPADLLPRLDSNQQPCGYEQPQVSAVTPGHPDNCSCGQCGLWDELFDKYATGLRYAPGDNWFDWWSIQGQLRGSTFGFRELSELPGAGRGGVTTVTRDDRPEFAGPTVG